MIANPDQDSKADRSLQIPKLRNIPLKLVLIIPFVTLITGAVGLVGYLSYWSGQEAVNKLALTLRQETTSRVTQYLDNYLATPVLINRINTDLVKSGKLDIQDLSQMEKYLVSQLKQFDDVNNILFGNEQGSARIVNSKMLLAFDSSKSNILYRYSFDADGNRMKILKTDTFFGRIQERPWYKAAVVAGKPVRIPIYAFSDNSSLSLNSSQPIYDSVTGKLLGVFSASSDLKFFQEFMTTLKISSRGQVFIIERDGLLVGDSTGNLPYQKKEKDGKEYLERTKVLDSENQLIRNTSRYLLSRFGSFNQIKDSSQIDFFSKGDRHFVQILPYQDDLGLDWLIVVVIPEADFMGEIQANTRWTFFLCGMTLFTALGMGIATARWITKPIDRLSRSSQAIAQRDWQSSAPIDLIIEDQAINNHPIIEIETLADSFHKMLGQLQDSHRKIAENLQQQELENQGILALLPDLIFINNVQGLFVKQLRTNSEDISLLTANTTDKSLSDVLPTELLSMRLHYIYQAIQTGEIQTYEQQIDLFGKLQDEEVRIIKISDQEVLVMIRNISDRKKAQKTLELQSVIMKNMAEGVCLVKVSDLTIVYTNPKFNAMFGYLEGELIGQPVGILNYIDTHVTPEVSVLDIAAQIDRDGEAEYEVHNKKKDGIPLWCRVHTSRFEHPEYGTVYVAVQQDITELRLAKRELIKAKEAAEAANLGKSIFLANMSHELRTPLNAVMGFSQVMQRTPGLPEEHYKNAGIIYRSGNYLLSLINNILDLSKIEANKTILNIQAFNLNNLLYDLEEMMNLRAKKSGLILVFEKSSDVPPYICTDEIKLKQVLINLLTNAIKFTRQGTITLRINCLPLGNFQEIPQDPSRLILGFSVEDTGVGIATEELPKIFEAFNQAEAGRNGQEGTGLGLSISRQFVQLMGGEMIVTSELGKGTTFQFQIPVQQGTGVVQPKTENHQRILGLAPGQAEYKILVVDDIEVNRQLLVKILSPLGFQVQEAKNGEEAIALWESWQPQLIWMDLRMPIMDGYTATKHIKSHPQGSNTTIIALTADVRQDDRAMVLAAGCDDFHTKPFEEQTIFDALSQHLGVSYLYAEESVANLETERVLTTGDFASMPPEWLQRLDDACAIGDFDLVTQLTTEIPATSSSFAKSLKELADQFQSEMIMKLIQPLIIP